MVTDRQPDLIVLVLSMPIRGLDADVPIIMFTIHRCVELVKSTKIWDQAGFSPSQMVSVRTY